MLSALTRTREAKVVVGLNAGVALVCAFLPLADHLGFELALALAITSAVAAPAIGFAAVRLDAAAGHDVRRPARAAAFAGLFAVLILVVPAGIILLNGLRRPACDPGQGALWLLVLSAPSAWLGATFGALVRQRVASRWRAVSLVVAIPLASLSLSLASMYTGPAYFALDHFFGYYPGPLYDETVLFSPALLSFRAATVAWGAAAVTAAGALGSSDRAARLMHASWTAVLVAVLSAAAFSGGPLMGWRTTDESLRRALGGELRIDSLVIHYPREWPERRVEELVRDAAFGAARVSEALGITPTKPVRIWMYRSPAEKLRMVGAEGTSFVKPWRREMHIHPAGHPHVPLRHELVHALAADLAGGPFAVPGGLIPNAALIEGLAEAYDVDDEGQTLAQRAKAMRELGFSPRLERILSATGFLREAPARAYVYAGAFIRFVHSTAGLDAVRTLYRTGELASIGDPASLIERFERSLDAIEIDEDARAHAARRFSMPSLFRRRCAREVSKLVDDGYALAANRQWNEALEKMEEACALQPDNPALQRDRLAVALRARELEVGDLLRVARDVWDHPHVDPILSASTRLQVGDELWRRGDTLAARTLYDSAAAIPAGSAMRRGAVVRLRAHADPFLRELLAPVFAEGEVGVSQLFRLSDAIARRPGDPLLGYLLGRQLLQRSSPGKAADLLEAADRAGLGQADIARENLRMLVRARAETHRCDEAENARSRLQSAGGSAADEDVARDWVARCRFEVARGWKPLVD